MFNKKVKGDKMKRIYSKLQRIRTYEVCKISFSCFDDKRCLLDDVINGLAYFHNYVKINKTFKALFYSVAYIEKINKECK